MRLGPAGRTDRTWRHLHVFEGDPATLGWPAGTGAAVAPVHGVGVVAAADAVLDVVDVVVGQVAVVYSLAGLAL